MVARRLARWSWVGAAMIGGGVVGAAPSASSAPTASTATTTSITIWNAPTVAPDAYGGAMYGGSPPPAGAMITLRRELEPDAHGELRVGGVPTTIDAASAQLHAIDPAALTVLDQRFVPGALTPDELLARHVGDAITVVTTKGEVAGTLRAVDAQTIVLEVGAGDQRHLQLLHRDGYVLDVKLPPGPSLDRAALVWRVATRAPGKQAVEITFRADGLSWSADYVAILDDAAHTLELAAWATIRNATGAAFDDAELTLIHTPAGAGGPVGGGATRATPAQFVVPSPVRLGVGEAVQVALLPARAAQKPRTIVAYEAQVDQSASFQAFPATDCNQFAGQGGTSGHADVELEVDTPTTPALPDGRVRLFRRGKARALELVTEDPLRVGAGVARIRLASATDVIGTRRTVSCALDERARTISETIEVTVDSQRAQAIDVVVREYLFRWPVAHIETEDVKGADGGPQTREYRVHLTAKARQTIAYTVRYSW